MAVFFDGTETAYDIYSDSVNTEIQRYVTKYNNKYYAVNYGGVGVVYKDVGDIFNEWSVDTNFPNHEDPMNNNSICTDGIYLYVISKYTISTSIYVNVFDGTDWYQLSITGSLSALRTCVYNKVLHLFRVNSNTMYHAYLTIDEDDIGASTFSSWNTLSNPANTSTRNIQDCAIDSSSNIHLSCRMLNTTTSTYYIYYNTGTYNNWNGWETVDTNSNIQNSSITLHDSTIYIAVTNSGNYVTDVDGYVKVYYGSSGSWNVETLETFTYFSNNNNEIKIFSNSGNIHVLWRTDNSSVDEFDVYTDPTEQYIKYAYYDTSSWSSVITMLTLDTPYVFGITIHGSSNDLLIMGKRYDGATPVLYIFYKSGTAYRLKKLSTGTWTAYPLKKLISGTWTAKELKYLDGSWQ